MGAARLNVLVYTGTGTTVESVRHVLFSLRALLSPNYAVIPITESILLKDPWQNTTALLAIPGGADLGYCRVLNGAGNRIISDFVRRGGAYLGLCAGGYYGSKKCEFEVGNGPMEVIGSRELAFFPGICRGAAYKGFEYKGEGGARAVRLKVSKEKLTWEGNGEGEDEDEVYSYFNGGGVFVDAASVDRYGKVEVLATYADEIDVDGGDGRAAVVFSQVGDGRVILTGPHPEFAPVNLYPQPKIPNYDTLIETLLDHDPQRIKFLRSLLTKLGLECTTSTNTSLPTLTPLHLSSINPPSVTETLFSWQDIIDKKDGEEYIHGETDTFHIENPDSRWGVDSLRESLPDNGPVAEGEKPAVVEDSGIVDYTQVVKKIVTHEEGYPHPKTTPQFNHELYYSSLKRYRQLEPSAETWGDSLLYGEVITSTNTILEKNPKIVNTLPTGFTVTATTQIAGRGRGTNVWVAPPGSLIFSTTIIHPAHLAVSRPVVFIQYLAAIAIVEAIQGYDRGYEDVPVKLKWPNDIYARDPTKPRDSNSYVKIGGILSQAVYSSGTYRIILGIGLNTINPRPTTSLADLLPNSSVSPPKLESLLAKILTRLEAVHAQFLREGFSRDLEGRYYRHWLHTGQLVTLEAEGGVKARVVGITGDWGMLKVEETDREGRGIGKMWALQSDENSFDYWKGLVRKKL